MPNPAALALALLLGHEARLNDEQWSEVKNMSNVTGGTNPGIVIGGTGQSSVDTGDVTDSSQRVITHHCPNCEAAQNDVRLMQARLQRLIDANPDIDAAEYEPDDTDACPNCEAAQSLIDKQAALLSGVAVALRDPEPPQTRWSHADLPERAAAVIRERDKYIEAYAEKEVARYDAEQEANHAQRQLADLRARVAAECDAISRKAMDEDDDYYIIAQQLRDLLPEKEAK